MNQKYPGLYLYFDWLEGIETMGAEDGFRLVMNLFHFAKDGTKPEPLEGSFNIVQNICIAQMTRSKQQSEAGKLGAAKSMVNRHKKEKLTVAKKRLDDMQSDGLFVDPEDDMDELAFLQSILNIEEEPPSASGSPLRLRIC